MLVCQVVPPLEYSHPETLTKVTLLVVTLDTVGGAAGAVCEPLDVVACLTGLAGDALREAVAARLW